MNSPISKINAVPIYNRGLMSCQMSLKYVTGIFPAIPRRKQSIDMLIYFEGFPTVFEILENTAGV